MRLLFDSHGAFIASDECGRLHALSGANVGHYLSREKVFIDQRGRYLGEVVRGNRLLDNLRSPYRDVGFAVPGVYNGSGTVGNPGNAGAVGPIEGYEDIRPERFA
jgi:hypothetical protein